MVPHRGFRRPQASSSSSVGAGAGHADRPLRAAREEAAVGSGSGAGSTLIDPRDQRPFSSARPSSAGRRQRPASAAHVHPGAGGSGGGGGTGAGAGNSSNNSNANNNNNNIYINHDIATSHLVRQRLAGGRPDLLMMRRQSSPAGLIGAAYRSQHGTARARSLPGSPRSSRAGSPKLYLREGLRRAHMPPNGGGGVNVNGSATAAGAGVAVGVAAGRPSPPDGRRSADFVDERQARSGVGPAPPSSFSSGTAAGGGRAAWTSPTGLLDSSGSDSDDEVVPSLFPLPHDVSGLAGLVPGNPESDNLEVEHPSMLLQESAYTDAAAKVRGNLVLAFAISGTLDGAKLVAAAETIASWQPALRTWFPGHRDERGALIARVMPVAAVQVQLDVVANGPGPAEEAAVATLIARLQASPFKPNSCAVRFCLVQQGGSAADGNNSSPHTLAVVFARYACDLVAAHVFMRQLCEIYSGRGEMLLGGGGGGGGNGAGSQCSVAQMAQWEAKHLRGNPVALEAASTFWSACCRDPIGEQTLHKLQLNNATTAAEQQQPQPRWEFHALNLDEDTTTNFKEFLVLPDGAEDISNADLGLLLSLTTFAVLMRHVSEQDDYVMGSTVSLRDLAAGATDGLLGPLTNEVPLHVITSQASSFIDIFVALGRMVISARQRAMCSVRSFKSLHGLDSFPVRFEFVKSADVAQIASGGLYSASFLGGSPASPSNSTRPHAAAAAASVAAASLGSDCQLTFRMPPPQGLYPAETNLVLRAWESPDSDSDQIYGGFWYRADLHSRKYIESLIQKFGTIAEEASDEPHITMAKVEAGLKSSA